MCSVFGHGHCGVLLDTQVVLNNTAASKFEKTSSFVSLVLLMTSPLSCLKDLTEIQGYVILLFFASGIKLEHALKVVSSKSWGELVPGRRDCLGCFG